MESPEKIQIIILAAGKGTRMKTDEPKALALLKGRPFLQHILETIKKLNTGTEPIIVVGYKKERIKEILGENHIYTEQQEQLGTGHAVMSAQNSIKEEHDIVLIISTDQPVVSKETLEHIISEHKKERPTITIGTVTVPNFEDWRVGLNHFGRIIRGNDNLVKGIVEFKDANEEEKNIKELNPALYAFDAKWLWENINKIKNENAQREYYIGDLLKIAFSQNKKINAVPITNIIEALQPNSKEELEMLEKLI